MNKPGNFVRPEAHCSHQMSTQGHAAKLTCLEGEFLGIEGAHLYTQTNVGSI